MPVEIESVIGMLNDMNKTMKQKIEDLANQSAGKIYDEMYKRLKDAAVRQSESEIRRLEKLKEKGIASADECKKRIHEIQDPIFDELIRIISQKKDKCIDHAKIMDPNETIYYFYGYTQDRKNLHKILMELYVSLRLLHDEYLNGFLSEWNKLDYLFPEGLTQGYTPNEKIEEKYSDYKGYHMDIEDFLIRLRDYDLPLVYSRCHFFCIAYRKMIKELSGDAGLGIENRSFAYDRDNFITFLNRPPSGGFATAWINFIFFEPGTGPKSPFTPVKVVMHNEYPKNTPGFNEKKAFLLFQCKLFAQRLELDPIFSEGKDKDYRFNKENVKVFNCDDIRVFYWKNKFESGKVTELVTKLCY